MIELAIMKELIASLIVGAYGTPAACVSEPPFVNDDGQAYVLVTLPVDHPFGTEAGCMMGSDPDGARALVVAGHRAIVLDGARLEFPANGVSCVFNASDDKALCSFGDRESEETVILAIDGDTATVTFSDGEDHTLQRCE